MPSYSEPVFLRQTVQPVSWRRVLALASGSVAVHLLIGLLLWVAPEVSVTRNVPAIVADVRSVSVPLVAPRLPAPKPEPKELTQTAPNKGKISHELDVRSAQEAPRPQTPRPRTPDPAPGPAVPPVAPVIEPPKIEVAAAPAPQLGRPQAPTAPSPAPSKPKLAFESVGANSMGNRNSANPNISLPVPTRSVQEAIDAVQSGGGGGAGLTVGDTGADANSLAGQAAPGRNGSNLQLLSDPQGVDFKPYLIQVLTLVRRNWMSVIPESARLGQRGRVLIQFVVDRGGGIPKLVIASASGAPALDRAAVAGLSASNPLPPLPQSFKGNEIRLQLAFTYNSRASNLR